MTGEDHEPCADICETPFRISLGGPLPAPVHGIVAIEARGGDAAAHERPQSLSEVATFCATQEIEIA
jgi:hypothetical protein